MWNHHLSDCRVIVCIDFESSPMVCQMHDIPHYGCIMNLVMSTLNYICAPPNPHPKPRLINIEGNSRSNNVLLTVHALLLRGGFAPCIPASQTHAHMFPSVIQWGEKNKKKSHTTLLIRAAQPALLCTRGPWQKQWCLRCRKPWVCPSLISKNSSSSCPVAADTLVCGSWHKLWTRLFLQ